VPAKFIALYGFDEFFEGIPKDIIKFEFTNNTNNEMAIDIPSTIGKFTNVEQLVLSNCVKSLPESIGNMKSLQFLILSKNPKLVKLPESIGSLPELTFLSLVESPNAEIPKSLADKLTEQTDRMYWIE
jgi:Leucine-rich repeat (LRR) protein